MIRHFSRVARCGATAALPLFIGALPVTAQKKGAPEFTQQFVYVANFWVAGSTTPSVTRADMKFGRRVGDGIRDRLEDLVQKRETKIISGSLVRQSMEVSSLNPDTVLSLRDLRQHGEFFRADELITGLVTRTPAGVRLEANIVLWRDTRIRQPLASVTNANVDRAIDVMARQIAEARVQLRFQRRCENALREGSASRSIGAAREGIAAYPRAALARTCLIWALRGSGAPANQILEESLALLAIDPVAPHALEAAALAYDSLKQRAPAADMWLRLAATDSDNVDLIERVVWSMAEGGNSRRAEPLIVRASDAHPENLRLLRQRWRVANDNRSWPLAVAAGERLLATDDDAKADSVFYLRLATAYRANRQIFKAVELVARGVATFPGDPRLYALYTQFVKTEADTAITRGLELYPTSAELLALNAKDLQAKGRAEEALTASKRAVELDSTIAQGMLMIAQGEIDLGRPDSALATLIRAAASGEDLGTVAQFALSKGNALLRAANGTKTRADFQLAMRFLAVADSLKPTPQTKFLLGAAAVSVAQTALTDAPKITVREESCVVSQLGADTIPLARASLEAGVDVSPEATRQYLEYLDVISPYAEKQIAAFCSTALPAKKGL
jgi:tetratricopeptide (TPR) repeat protein